MANFFRALGAATPALNVTARTLMEFGQQMREAPMLKAQTALTQQRAEQMKFEMEQAKKEAAELDAPIEGSILFDQFTQGFTEEQKKQGKEMLTKYGILSPDGLTSKRKIADAQKMILVSEQASKWVQTAKRDASLRQGQDIMAKLQKAKESQDQGKIDEYTKAYDEWSKNHNIMLGNFENLEDIRMGMALLKEVRASGIEIPPEAMAVISAAANTGQNTKEAVAILKDLAVKSKTKKTETPTVKTFDIGNKTVTKQWNSETGTWDTLSEAPRWQPKEAPTPTEFDKKWAKAKAALPPGATEDEVAKKMKDMFGSGAGGVDAMKLRKEFDALPEVKEYKKTKSKYLVMTKALEQSRRGGNLVGVDQALINLYNKMTDPESVVRESEYARTGQNMPIVNSILGKFAKWRAGGAGLTSEEREALVIMAKEFNDVYTQAYNETAGRYRTYATQAGLQPEDVVAADKEEKPSGRPLPTF